MKQKSASEIAIDWPDYTRFLYDNDDKFVHLEDAENAITAAIENERVFFMETIEEMKSALEFYEYDKNKNYAQWIDHVGYDFGKRARDALEKYKERFGE